MFVAKLTPGQIYYLVGAIGQASIGGHDLRIAFDPIDNSIKWKLGDYTWSPPIRTEED